MRDATESLIGRVRQPEHTGENRCVPCTVVNVVIALLLTAGLLFVHVAAAGAVLVVALAAIALRGYLVPGTPTLTKRYLPDRVLSWFGKEPATVEIDANEEVDPERVLVEHGVLEPCADVDDLCLEGDIQAAFEKRIEHHRDRDHEERLGELLSVSPADLSIEPGEDAVRARIDGRLAGKWESEAALVADLAAADVLTDAIPAWDERSPSVRATLAGGVRAFVDRCPSCDGPISVSERSVESCCHSWSVYAISCGDCGARVLEVPAET